MIEKELWADYIKCLRQHTTDDHCYGCDGCPFSDAIERETGKKGYEEWALQHELAMQAEILRLEELLNTERNPIPMVPVIGIADCTW